MKKPCSDCPFRKDSRKGWLGSERMDEIISASSFVCHKTTQGKTADRKQCAGHMMSADYSEYVDLAHRMKIDLELTGGELLFKTPEEAIKHHQR